MKGVVKEWRKITLSLNKAGEPPDKWDTIASGKLDPESSVEPDGDCVGARSAS